MAYLFEVKDKTVTPTTEALLTEPFKTIWNRDKSKKKEIAIQEFTYIEFMVSMKKSNPFKDYPEDRKEFVIVENVIKKKGWKPDLHVKKGIEVIENLQREGSLTYSYYIAAKTAAEEMKSFFLTFKLTERNEKTGNPIYKPADITRALNDTEKTLKTLDTMKKKVEEELFELTKTRGQKEISIFAIKK